jgi:metal-responsive CopG/Arc/MetJ family transcriptional regulator
MRVIQIVIDKELLDAVDHAARHSKQNRSELMRDAVREHLKRLDLRAKEQRDREGYLSQPHSRGESHAWELEAVWPAE